MPILKLKLLGGFELRDGAGAEIPLRSKKARGLLGYLALNPGRRHDRETLATLLWGERFDAQARQSLRQALVMLRKRLGEGAREALRTDDQTVSLGEAAVRVDAVEFEQLARAGNLEDAAKAYGGDLLDGLRPQSEVFDDWLALERARLHDLACEVWQGLGERRLADGDTDAAIEAGRRLLALDPLREPGHRLLMHAHARAGRRVESIQQYRRLAETLERELGAEPAPETERLLQEIQGADFAPDAAALAPAPPDAEVPESGTPFDRPSLAVLPFENMSGDADQEYFSDGITEDIITALSKSRFFFVISRNSTFAYKGAKVDVKQVARDLGIRYVVEGTVRRAGERVRITAQLIDAETDTNVWAERFDRVLEDVFTVQDEITRSIVASIAPEFVSAEIYRARRKEDRSLDVWDSFIRAYWHLSRFTEEDIAEAGRLCREAIEMDPGGAGQHSLLAVVHLMEGLYGWSKSWHKSLRAAREAAERGVRLDDHDAMAIRSLGLIDMYARRHDDAIFNFRRAIDLDPHEAENHALLGSALALAGDYEGARAHVEYAIRLSPRDTFLATWYSNLGMAAVAAGKNDDAVEWARIAVRQNPPFPGGHRTLAAAHALLGQLAEARAACDKLRQLLPGLTIAQLRERLPFKEEADLERYLDGLRQAGLPEQ